MYALETRYLQNQVSRLLFNIKHPPMSLKRLDSMKETSCSLSFVLFYPQIDTVDQIYRKVLLDGLYLFDFGVVPVSQFTVQMQIITGLHWDKKKKNQPWHFWHTLPPPQLPKHHPALHYPCGALVMCTALFPQTTEISATSSKVRQGSKIPRKILI